MDPITQLQRNMLQQMEQMKQVSEGVQFNGVQITEASTEAGFASSFDSVLHSIDQQQHQANALRQAVDSGQSDDLVGAMIESQKASVSFTALLQVRNKLTSAFEEVMRMSM
jgi:flagellar hook-basal body complex protein FliE